MVRMLLTSDPGECPDCGRPTSLFRASLVTQLGTDWEIQPEILKEIYRSAAARYRYCKTRADPKKLTKTKAFACIYCDLQCFPRLHWLMYNSYLEGPICRKCLEPAVLAVSDERGVRNNHVIYLLPAGKGTITKARAVLLLKEPEESEIVISEDEIILF